MRLAFTNFSIKSPTGKKSGRFFLALFLGIFLFLTHPMLCQAGFASSTPFTGASWELVGEYPILGSNGAVQSVCATEDYIICIENFNDLTTEPDVVSAYYKNDTDADGNPVTQYSLAHQVRDADFAHANGMAYNPVTHEILVSGYSSPDASNYGCIFRLDPDTLEQKERIQLSTSYNILGIDYLPSTGGYLIQTDADGGYGFKLLDASLQVMDDWGTYPFDFYMENFQDLCVSGDLFFLFPLTMHLGIGNFIQTYSLSQKTLLADDTVDFGFSDDITINEPDGPLRDKSWGIYCDCKRNKGRWWTVRAVLPHPGAVSVHGFHFHGGAWLGVRGRGSFPRRGKNRFLHGRRRLPAREALGGRLVSAGDGISGQLHIFRYPEGSYPCRNV